MTRLHKSEAQSIAEQRTTTYASDHRASFVRTRDRSREPATLRELVGLLRRAYAAEIPNRLHKRDLTEGGHPEYSGEFAAFLYGSAFTTDDEGNYQTPVRRCLAAMVRSKQLARRQMGGIVLAVVVGGNDPEDAVRRVFPIEDNWACRAIANQALLTFWRDCSAVRLDLAPTVTMV